MSDEAATLQEVFADAPAPPPPSTDVGQVDDEDDDMRALIGELDAMRVGVININVASALSEVRRANFKTEMRQEREDMQEFHEHLYERAPTIDAITLRQMLINLNRYGYSVDWPRLVTVTNHEPLVIDALTMFQSVSLDDEAMLTIFKNRPKLFGHFVECWKSGMFYGSIKSRISYAMLPFEIFSAIVDDRSMFYSEDDLAKAFADPEIDERNKQLLREKHKEQWMKEPWAAPFVREIITATMALHCKDFKQLDRALATRLIAACYKLNPNLSLSTTHAAHGDQQTSQ